jgi:hypothetical protein
MVVLATMHLRSFPLMSHFDEGVHFDYVVEVSQGGLIAQGERLGQEAMRETACRGIDTAGLVVPPCGREVYQPTDFPELGYNYADAHPPVYYAITALVARLLTATGLVDSFFVAARAVSILWVGLGLVVLWIVGKELTTLPERLGVAMLLLVAAPPVIHTAATVNNDAPALLAGGAVLLVTLRWERGASPTWLLGGVAALVPLFKTTNVVAVGLCALYLLLRRPSRSSVRSGLRGRALGAGVLVLAATASVAAWLLVHAQLGRDVAVPLETLLFVSNKLSFASVLAEATAILTPFAHWPANSVFEGGALRTVANLTSVLVAAPCLFYLLTGSFRGRTEALGSATGLAMVTGGPTLHLVNFILLGLAFGIQSRYGLSILPMLCLVLAGSLRWRGATIGVAMLALLAATLAMAAMIEGV